MAGLNFLPFVGDQRAPGTVWKRGLPTPSVPTLPTPPNAEEEQRAAEAAAKQAAAAQRRRARTGAGRSSTLLTRPATLGQATTQRPTLLGL